jgi:mRNA-degrading endonuclease YafQ of YafQ-DinJ toxin-antitoxin module
MSGPFYSPYAGKLFKEISHVPEFEKDLKKLLKRFSSLEEDLKTFMKVAMNIFHKQKIDSGAIVHISDLRIHSPKVCKGRKFACKALKGKGVQSGIRVIYAYHEEEDRIEFLEIYYKGDKESEDRERIVKYFGKS